MAAEGSSLTATSRSLKAASCEATRRATGMPSEETASTEALAVLARAMKWAGVALLAIAGLVYARGSREQPPYEQRGPDAAFTEVALRHDCGEKRGRAVLGARERRKVAWGLRLEAHDRRPARPAQYGLSLGAREVRLPRCHLLRDHRPRTGVVTRPAAPTSPGREGCAPSSLGLSSACWRPA